MQHPLICSGYITAWHMCFYTDNIVSNTDYRVYLRVYRNNSNSQVERVHHVVKDIRLNSQQARRNTFMCMSAFLNGEDYLSVSAGDYLATYIPTVNQPLQIVGNNVSKSFLYRDTRSSFSSRIIGFSDLEVIDGGFLHLHADVGKCLGTINTQFKLSMNFVIFSVGNFGLAPRNRKQMNPEPTGSTSYVPTSTSMPSPTPNGTQNDINDEEVGSSIEEITNSTDSDGDSDSVPPSHIAAIASVTATFILLVVLVIIVALGIVVYRRWKVEQIKKGLLEIYPAHLAIGTIIPTLEFTEMRTLICLLPPQILCLKSGDFLCLQVKEHPLHSV